MTIRCSVCNTPVLPGDGVVGTAHELCYWRRRWEGAFDIEPAQPMPGPPQAGSLGLRQQKNRGRGRSVEGH